MEDFPKSTWISADDPSYAAAARTLTHTTTSSFPYCNFAIAVASKLSSFSLSERCISKSNFNMTSSGGCVTPLNNPLSE